jgi:hypothetical protein
MTTTRYAWAAAFACVYTALTVWLVGAQGRSYRESLRRERDRGHGVTSSVTAGPAAAGIAAPSPIVTLPPRPTGVPPDASVVEHESRGAAQPTVVPPSQAPAPAAANPEALAANVAANPSNPTPLAPESLRPPSTPAERSPGAAWADSLDLARLTPEEEARLGAELHRLVLASNLVDRDGDIQRLKRTAAPLLASVSRKEVEYKFTILDSDEVNAFSLPGGYLYVSRGLFHLVGETTDPEQDYALQFALGHEIAHVDLKHALTLVAPGQARAQAQGIDTLQQLLMPIGLGYPDAQEFAADAWAYQRMTTRLNHTRREGLMFLVKLQGFSERNGFRNGRELPELKSGRTLVENHYRSHPAAWDRFERLKSRAVRPAEVASPPR